MHRYLSQQGKAFTTNTFIVGVFLPSLQGTSIDFLREILNEKKSHLKSNEVIHLDIPKYAEVSVKDMYDDALSDEVLARYLPSKK